MEPFLRTSTENLESKIKDIDYIYIPAGSNQKINGELKHNLFFGEKTILENTIDLSLNLGYNVISTVKNSQELREKYSQNDNVLILEARDNLIDSSIYALIEGYINHYSEPKFTKNWANIRKIKTFLKENSNLEDLTCLCVASDSPFLSSKDLKKFISHYESKKTKPDIYVGLTNMEKLSEFERSLKLNIQNLNSTVTNYCITDKGHFRISNMYIVKPFKTLKAGLAGTLQKIYDNRKLSQGITQYLGMLSGLGSILTKAIRSPLSSLHFANDLLTASKHFRGNYDTKELIELKKAFKNTSQVIGLNVKADTTCNISGLLDIDDEESYFFFKENYDTIQNYLRSPKDYEKNETHLSEAEINS